MANDSKKFLETEERKLALKLEKKVESKLGKDIKSGRGDPGYNDIDLGVVTSGPIQRYLLKQFNRCSHKARFIDEQTIRVSYSCHY